MDTHKFSLKHARLLVDLCVSAQSSGQELLIKEDGDELYAAFYATGDADESSRIAFTDGFAPLVEAYRHAAAEKINALRGRTVWLTGHGMGGVFALLAAAELLAEGGAVAAVYTFGTPRAGDAQFVKALLCPIFRVVNNLDVMATVPPPWRWRHAGKQILINADGRLNLHPNPVNRLPSLLRQTWWLGEMLAQGLTSGYPRALNTLLNQVLGDHALESYRNRLHALSE